MSEKNKEEIKTTSQPVGAREFCDGCDHGVVAGHVCELCGGTGYKERRQQTAALTDKLCKIQDDIASLVSTYRSDWSWNDVVEDVKKLVEERDNLKKQTAAKDAELDKLRTWVNCGGVPTGKQCLSSIESGHDIYGPFIGDGAGNFICEFHAWKAAERERDSLREQLEIYKQSILRLTEENMVLKAKLR